MNNQPTLQKLSDFEDKSLLIVDDDNPFRQRLARAMEKKGFTVTQAESVKIGIETVKSQSPAFAVVDLRLNDGNGFEVVKEIQKGNIKSRIVHAFEIVAALVMAAMFATFILQVTIRYTARAEWIKDIFPFLDPTLYGWTLDFCLLMWIWMVFWGNGLIVRQRDHVIFDMLYTSVSPKIRKWLAIISALIIAITLLIVI